MYFYSVDCLDHVNNWGKYSQKIKIRYISSKFNAGCGNLCWSVIFRLPTHVDPYFTVLWYVDVRLMFQNALTKPSILTILHLSSLVTRKFPLISNFSTSPPHKPHQAQFYPQITRKKVRCTNFLIYIDYLFLIFTTLSPHQVPISHTFCESSNHSGLVFCVPYFIVQSHILLF